MCSLFFSGFVYCAANLYQLCTVCKENTTIAQLTSPVIWKQHAVPLGIFGCQYEDKTEDVKRDESNSVKEIPVARKTQSDRSHKKRNTESFGEIQTSIDNDPSKSIRSIIWDMGVFVFLIRQVVHEDIRYFSYNMKKEPIFITC